MVHWRVSYIPEISPVVEPNKSLKSKQKLAGGILFNTLTGIASSPSATMKLYGMTSGGKSALMISSKVVSSGGNSYNDGEIS